jgi:hypothetical protein
MGVTNDSFHLAKKTHKVKNLLKCRQYGKANAEAQFFKISGEMSWGVGLLQLFNSINAL